MQSVGGSSNQQYIQRELDQAKEMKANDQFKSMMKEVESLSMGDSDKATNVVASIATLHDKMTAELHDLPAGEAQHQGEIIGQLGNLHSSGMTFNEAHQNGRLVEFAQGVAQNPNRLREQMAQIGHSAPAATERSGAAPGMTMNTALEQLNQALDAHPLNRANIQNAYMLVSQMAKTYTGTDKTKIDSMLATLGGLKSGTDGETLAGSLKNAADKNNWAEGPNGPGFNTTLASVTHDLDGLM